MTTTPSAPPSPRSDSTRRSSAGARAEPTAKASAEGRPSHPTRPTAAGRQHEPAAAGAESMDGLHIIAPPSSRAIPSATARCRCGHTWHARGRDDVQVLIDTYTRHRAACDGTPATHRRAAA